MTQHLRTYPDHLYYDILWYKEQSLHFTFYHLPCAPLYHKDMWNKSKVIFCNNCQCL